MDAHLHPFLFQHMKKDITIVTAFKDLGRNNWSGIRNNKKIPSYIKRSTDTYIERFLELCKLNNKIFCFIDDLLFDELSEKTKKYKNVVLNPIDYILKQHSEIDAKIQMIQHNTEFINFLNNPEMPEYWNSQYVLINYLKSTFVSEYIRLSKDRDIYEKASAWIDFGYCRTKLDAPEGKTFVFDPQRKIQIWTNGVLSNDDLEYNQIINFTKSGDVCIQGPHIIANNDDWPLLKKIMHRSLTSMLECGIIDDDQTMLLMCVRRNPKLFNLNYGNPNDWFNVIRNNCV